MSPLYQFCKYFDNLAFYLTIVLNLFFIFVTKVKITAIMGVYKTMVVIFAFFGIIFSLWKFIAQPFTHHYNRSIIMFSLSGLLEDYPEIQKFSVAIYFGFPTLIIAFLVVQFVYRILVIASRKGSKMFEGFGIIGWILYPIIFGGLCSFCAYKLKSPDEYADDYIRYEMLNVYGMDVNQIGRFIVIPYNADDSLRWPSMVFFITEGVLMGFQYLIIAICGLIIRFDIPNQLENLSLPHRKLHNQFFEALAAQTLIPTVLFVLPLIILQVGLFLDLKWSLQSGIVISLQGIYPLINTITFMMIVTEYKKAIKEMFRTPRIQQVSCVTV